MKTVSGLSGVDAVAMDMKGKGKELTITGDINPVTAVAELRKERVEIGDIYSGLNTSGNRQTVMMKKIVFKLEIYDDKYKSKAMKTVSCFTGVESIAIDMTNQKLTITGDIDPVRVVAKLRKLCYTERVAVGPAKEREKKKEEPHNEIRPKKDVVTQLLKAYRGYHQQLQPPPTYYYSRSVEEDQNSCGLNTSIKLRVDLDLDFDSDSETPSLCASLTLSPCVNVCFCLSACLSS